MFQDHKNTYTHGFTVSRNNIKHSSSIMSLSQKALSSYRQALRATNLAFQGDIKTLRAAQNQLKTRMKLQTDPEAPTKTVEERIQLLDSVSFFLRKNIVQGRQDPGNEQYFLNIHKDTELGDNDTIGGKKRKKMTMGDPSAGIMSGGGCCGGGNKVLKERTA